VAKAEEAGEAGMKMRQEGSEKEAGRQQVRDAWREC